MYYLLYTFLEQCVICCIHVLSNDSVLLDHVMLSVCSGSDKSIPVCSLLIYVPNNAVYQSSKLCTQSQVSLPVLYSFPWHFLMLMLSLQMGVFPRVGIACLHCQVEVNIVWACKMLLSVSYFFVGAQHVVLVFYPSTLSNTNNISSVPRGDKFYS